MLDHLRLREHSSAAAQKLQLRLTKPWSWRLPKQSSSIAPPDVWTNADMDPVPPEKRTWGRGAFVTYWVSDLITISTWSSGSAVVTLGSVCFWLSSNTAHSYRTLCYRRRVDYIGRRSLQCRADRLQRRNRCKPACAIPHCSSSQSWLLVQLLRCRESRHLGHVLVWCSYRLRWDLCLSCMCAP
jgi:hypothetical protein